MHEAQVFLNFEYVAKQPPILLEQGLILKVSAGHMGSQLLTTFQSITPAVHASVNFAPDWFEPAILSVVKSQNTG